MIPSSVTKFYGRARNWAQRLRSTPRRRPIRRLQLEALEERNLMDAGTWSPLANIAPTQIGTMHLLSDGTVMAQGDGPGVNSITKDWYKLTPDSSGSYQNGSWSQLASMNSTRLYFGSNVLPDGTLFVQGGEYSSAGSFTRTGETYDPIADSWSNHANFPFSSFGDDPTIVLPNGTILTGYLSGAQTNIYDPVSDTWTPTGTKLHGDRSDEETWTLLPNGNVLSYDVFASVSAGVGHAQYYDSSSGTWNDAGTVPGSLLTSSGVGFEMGPAILLPNGLVLQIGALAHTALYDYTTNTWTQGPDIPGNFGADDAPAAILPDGQVIFLADAGPQGRTFSPPTHVFDYDYASNTITDITGDLPSDLQRQLNSQSAYQARMLVLPSGELLLAPDNQGGGGNQLWIFTPDNSTGDPSWQPTIADITPNDDGSQSFTLTGTQLNGISQGSSYGDDAESDTNYPIVQLADGNGNVFYARTTGWTPGVSAVGDTTTQTVTFTPPDGLATGDYSVTVIANGIASDPTTIHIDSSSGPSSGQRPGDPMHAGSVATAGIGTPSGPTNGAAADNPAAKVLAADDVTRTPLPPTGTVEAVSSPSRQSALDNLFISLGAEPAMASSAVLLGTKNGDVPSILGGAFNTYLPFLASASTSSTEVHPSHRGDHGNVSSLDQEDF